MTIFDLVKAVEIAAYWDNAMNERENFLGEELKITSDMITTSLKNKDGYKRIVLFNDSMMVCDMESSIELPKVADYLQRYNFNGYIDKKFSDVESFDIKGGN